MSNFLPLLHVPQACLSVYSIYLSSIAVPKLQRYEEKAEKAAQYSNVAEHQLHKTITTQTSGVLTVSRLIGLVLLWSNSILACDIANPCCPPSQQFQNFHRIPFCRERHVLLKYLTLSLLANFFSPHIYRIDGTTQLSSTMVQTAAQYRQLRNLHLRLHAYP